MKLAHLDLGERPVLLAPMEDVSDPPFRRICKRFGADLLFTEFISSGGLVYEANDSVQKLDFDDSERPLAIQIFGGNVDQVRAAAEIVDAKQPDIIDINFGCPVKKVVCRDGGAGILRNLPKMKHITEEVISVATRPVTVKTRLGWNDDSIRIVEVATMLEEVGVAALAVHARTRSQMYKGDARWEWFRRIKDEAGLSIPLVGNGDATTPEKIERMFDETGVDAVMVGRGAIGNPWIFRDAHAYMTTGTVPEQPTWEERIEVVVEHLIGKCNWLGERKGVLEMRRMYGGYFKGFRNASLLRSRIMEKTERDDVIELLNTFDPGMERPSVPVERKIVRATLPSALPR